MRAFVRSFVPTQTPEALQFKENLPYAEQLFICRTARLLIYLTIRWAQLGISIVQRHAFAENFDVDDFSW